MEERDRPELRSLARRGGSERAWLVVGVVLLFVGLAVWKPWSAAPTPSAPLAVVQPVLSPRPVVDTRATPGPSPGSAVPHPGDAQPAGPLFEDAALWVIDGLDWAGGYEDPHRAWGVAVAYLPFGRLDDALVLRHSAIAPTVRWLALDPRSGPPDAASPGPLAGVLRQPVVALALTWPTSVQPVSEQLDYLGPLSSRTDTARPMPLDSAVPALVHLAAPGPVSGTFTLPPDTRARHVIDWLADGWPAGRYRFTVTFAGVTRGLSFRLDSGT